MLCGFLPPFNAQFRGPAQQAQLACRPLDSSIFLERVLCFKPTRQVARDNTCSRCFDNPRLICITQNPGLYISRWLESNGWTEFQV